MKKYLIAVDLEGIHGIKGVPNESLKTEEPDYNLSIENATKEINVLVKALFDKEADQVSVWDNHWQGKNIDFSKVDPRAVKVENVNNGRYHRFAFAKDKEYDGIFYIGYHAREGTINGVLAHTYSSQAIQYYEINGKQYGECEIDSFIASEKHMRPMMISSDDVCVNKVHETIPNLPFVITKIGKGRNEAEFFPEDIVLKQLYSEAQKACDIFIKPISLKYPAILKIRFTRPEEALRRMNIAHKYNLDTKYGEDSHIIVTTINQAEDLELFL